MSFRIRWLLSVILLIFSSCSVSKEKIQKWKDVESGEVKILEAMNDTGLELSLRIEAAKALGELNEMKMLQGGFKSEQNKEVASGLIKFYIKSLRADSGVSVVDQKLMRDVAFSVREFVSDEEKKELDSALAKWLLADWSDRHHGYHAGSKILRAMGKKAAPLIADKMKTDSAELVVLARILGSLEDLAARDHAAARLIKMAKDNKGPSRSILEALGGLKTAVARKYLGETASFGEKKHRVAALQALKLCLTDDYVANIATIAKNKNNPGDVREAAFFALEGGNSEKIIAELRKLMVSSEEVVRYRAMEALISCCQLKGARNLLDALSLRYSYAEDDVKDFIESDLKSLKDKVLPLMREKLETGNILVQMIAVRLLGEKGGKTDIGLLKKMLGNKGKPKGFKLSISDAAYKSIEKIQNRLNI